MLQEGLAVLQQHSHQPGVELLQKQLIMIKMIMTMIVTEIDDYDEECLLQECSTAEEYKELLTLMEERLRVMRQVILSAATITTTQMVMITMVMFKWELPDKKLYIFHQF